MELSVQKGVSLHRYHCSSSLESSAVSLPLLALFVASFFSVGPGDRLFWPRTVPGPGARCSERKALEPLAGSGLICLPRIGLSSCVCAEPVLLPMASSAGGTSLAVV